MALLLLGNVNGSAPWPAGWKCVVGTALADPGSWTLDLVAMEEYVSALVVLAAMTALMTLL